MSLVKIAHFYWGGNPLSYLRFLTVKSFILCNPDWEVRFHVPREHYDGDAEWVSHSHKIRYTGPDYMELLPTIGVKPQVFSFKAAGFKEDIHEAYKSDFLRWYVLYNSGGFWSDLDVIFFKPLTVDIFEEYDFCITADMNPTVYYIAYIYSSKQCPAAGTIMRASLQKCNFDSTNYQCLGNVLVQKCFPYARSFNQVHKDVRYRILNPAVNLPVKRIRNIGNIFENGNHINLSDSVGLHWFGGHPMATKWENILTPQSIKICQNNLCNTIRSMGL